MRSAPASRGLSVRTEMPVRTPGSTTTGSKWKYSRVIWRMACVHGGTTEESATPVISFVNDSPSWPRNPANSKAISSAVRSGWVAMRQWWMSSRPRNTPRAVSEFPTFTTSSTWARLPWGETGSDLIHCRPRRAPVAPPRSSASCRLETDVVDQARRPHPCCHQRASRPDDLVDALEGLLINHGNVVQAGQRLGVDSVRDFRRDPERPWVALPHALRGGLEGLRQAQRGLPFLRGEVGVPGRHGQPIGLPHDRAAHHLDGEREVRGHPPDQEQLLEVLLPEVGPAPAGPMEQLGHDREDAPEMPGPGHALQPLPHGPGIDSDLRAALRIHLLHLGDERDVDALRLGLREIQIQVTLI